MKKLKSTLRFTSTFLLSISAMLFFSKVFIHKVKAEKFNNIIQEKFDDSLRNYHPNKGE